MTKNNNEPFTGYITNVYFRRNAIDVKVLSGVLKVGDILDNGYKVAEVTQSVCSGFLGYAPLLVVLEGDAPEFSLSGHIKTI